jgi:hypothetical protein
MLFHRGIESLNFDFRDTPDGEILMPKTMLSREDLRAAFRSRDPEDYLTIPMVAAYRDRAVSAEEKDIWLGLGLGPYYIKDGRVRRIKKRFVIEHLAHAEEQAAAKRAAPPAPASEPAAVAA